MKLTETYINNLYYRLKTLARRYVSLGRNNLALRCLEMASHTAYTFYLGYKDDEIEGLLSDISQKTIDEKPISKIEGKHRVVFLDTFSQDTQGLTMQYVEAIITAGWEMLYLTSFDLDDPRSRNLKSVLHNCESVTISQVPMGLKPVEKVRWVYDEVMNFSPQDVFLHISPSAVSMVCAVYALPKNITRYQINLTDHSYWVGAGCMDYSFEFRPYGASISTSFRGFSRDQILMLPYYPVMKDKPFEGFPKEAEGKVKIFSGASYYKIIDREDTFFKICKAILDVNQSAVILFAGGGDKSLINALIIKYGLENRFLLIGQRNDIFQCFMHSDIYLSTYPLWGGLMSQYAAHASLPILAYRGTSKGQLEEVVCQKQYLRITLPKISDVVIEASRLISDTLYRKKRGALMHSCVIGREAFDTAFIQSIQTHTSQYPQNINTNQQLHDLDIQDKLKLMNSNGEFARMYYYICGPLGFRLSPRLWVDGFKARIKKSRFLTPRQLSYENRV